MTSSIGSGYDDEDFDPYTFPGGGTEDDLIRAQELAAEVEQEGDGEEQEDGEEAEEEDDGAEGEQTGTGSSWEQVPGGQTSGEASASAGEQQDAWREASQNPNRGRPPRADRNPQYQYHGETDWNRFTGTYTQSGVNISRDQRGRADDSGGGLKPGDAPPVWDGKDPQKYVRPYIKSLRAWLVTTRTQKQARGYVLLHASRGDLKELFDQIDDDDLTKDECPEKMLALVKEMYGQYLKRPIPEIVENALYDQAKTTRKASETMMVYIMRKTRYWNEMEKEKITLPNEMKCYLLYRGANLNTTQMDTIQTWTQGEWDLQKMKDALVKLEHHTRNGLQLHGQHKVHLHYNTGETSLIAFGSDAGPVTGSAGLPGIPDEGDCYVFIEECYWTAPESYDDELLEDFVDYFYDDDVIYIPDDWLAQDDISEHDVVTILANYGQVRKYLTDKAKARGFFNVPRPGKGKGRGKSPSKGKGKGRGKGKHSHARPVRSSKKWLINRSKCARCGQVGHWAQSCTNPPDAKGAARARMPTRRQRLAGRRR